MHVAPSLNHPKVGFLHHKEVALQIAPTLKHPRVGLPRAVAAVQTRMCGAVTALWLPRAVAAV